MPDESRRTQHAIAAAARWCVVLAWRARKLMLPLVVARRRGTVKCRNGKKRKGGFCKIMFDLVTVLCAQTDVA